MTQFIACKHCGYSLPPLAQKLCQLSGNNAKVNGRSTKEYLALCVTLINSLTYVHFLFKTLIRECKSALILISYMQEGLKNHAKYVFTFLTSPNRASTHHTLI